MKTPLYTAKAFIDENFEIVDVVSIDFESQSMRYKIPKGIAQVPLSKVLWIKMGNNGRINLDGQVNKKQ